MSLFRSVSGSLRAELTGADIAASLDAVMGKGISLYALETVDDVTVRFTVGRRDFKLLEPLLTRRGDRIVLKNRVGLYWYLQALFLRPVLLVGMMILLILGILLPSRVLFVEVEGNERIPARLILEAAADSGIRFGASRRAVRSERMKNSLLDALPELQWAGVNTYGCRAVISVRERPVTPDVPEKSKVSSIVAAVDGVVKSCTATRGTAVCVPGQAVKAGEILISGYTDCGITLEATRAEGEVLAETRRELTVKMPSVQLVRAEEGQRSQKFSLLLGKKRINFYKGSGISNATCVKMYLKYILTLPGGFELPVALVKETVIPSESVAESVPDPADRLSRFAAEYLTGRMVCGTILTGDQTLEESDGAYWLKGVYACTEMIGMEQDEKIGDFNG